MRHAQQSSTYGFYGCAGGKCTAEKALDDKLDTIAYTNNDSPPWWSVEFETTVKIENILVYADEYNFNQGYFTNFKVETGITKDAWELCKGPYDVQRPINPHVITCDTTKIAKYIRVTRVLDTATYLMLAEVKVAGSIQG